MVDVEPTSTSTRGRREILDGVLKVARRSLQPADREVVDLLRSHVAGTLESLDAVQLFACAAVLLRQQGRVNDVTSSGQFGLRQYELIWAGLYPFLKDCGYSLRDRLAPGWTNTESALDNNQALEYMERNPDAEHIHELNWRTAAATCRSTGSRVMLKILSDRQHHVFAKELSILKYLNEEPQRSHPNNISVPVLRFFDLADIPDQEQQLFSGFSVIVMPVLRERSLGLCGTYLDLFRQSLEGLSYLHSLGIAHGDLAWSNVLMSEDGPPFRVYFIDFGLARRFKPNEAPLAPWYGAQVNLPECEGRYEEPYNAFKGDVYGLASAFNAIKILNYAPLTNLLRRMSHDNPAKRPTAKDCVRLYHEKVRAISKEMLDMSMLDTQFPVGGRRGVGDIVRGWMGTMWIYFRRGSAHRGL